MNPTMISGANAVYGARGEKGIRKLHVQRSQIVIKGVTQDCLQSTWEPSEKERAALLAGAPLILTVVAAVMPMCSVDVGTIPDDSNPYDDPNPAGHA